MNYLSLKSKLNEMFLKNNVTELADIDWIMVEVLGVKRSKLILVDDISKEDEQKILELATERVKHKPLAYLLGKSNFYGNDFMVSPKVLIPRMDTEILIDEMVKIIDKLNKNVRLLDIGTGSGAIAITLALKTAAVCTATDISDDALEVAKQNARNLKANVEFIKSNLFENLDGKKFDLIVSNPPYIKTKEIEGLEPEVALNEPILALDGGDDGLKFYRQIVKEAKNHLNPNGYLIFEIGYDQAESVKELMAADFEEIEVVKDYGNNDRVVYGKLKEKI